MKIGIYIDSVEAKGGEARVVANLCHGWANAGWKIYLITASPGEPAFTIPVSVKRHTLAIRPRRNGIRRIWDNIRLAFLLGRYSREQQLDGILAISVIASLQLAVAPCSKTMIKAGSEHGYARHYSVPWYVKVGRRVLYPFLDFVICPATQSAIALREDCPGCNSVNIPNWIIWPQASSKPSNGLQVIPRRRLFVTSGRLVFDKGFDTVLESFSRVATLLPDWDLAIIGDGPAAESLKEKATTLGIAPRVHFHGFIDNAHEIYEKSDIFVYASPCEGFGMVIAEAQASGLPVVCYDCLAGPRDIVTDGVDGYLIKLGDIDGFVRSLYSLASDHGTREKMASAARMGRRRFEDAALMPKWAKIFAK